MGVSVAMFFKRNLNATFNPIHTIKKWCSREEEPVFERNGNLHD